MKHVNEPEDESDLSEADLGGFTADLLPPPPTRRHTPAALLAAKPILTGAKMDDDPDSRFGAEARYERIVGDEAARSSREVIQTVK